MVKVKQTFDDEQLDDVDEVLARSFARRTNSTNS